MENKIEVIFNNLNLSINTILLYRSNLRRLGITEIDDLNNTRLIEEKLIKYSPNTRRSYLTSIVVLLKNVIQRVRKYNYLYNFYQEWLSMNKSKHSSHFDIYKIKFDK